MNSLERIRENEGKKTSDKHRFIILLLVGSVTIFVGIIVLIIAALFYGNSTINFGGVIFIGPFPIAIGIGPDAILMVLFSIILAVLSVIMFLMLHRETVKIHA